MTWQIIQRTTAVYAHSIQISRRDDPAENTEYSSKTMTQRIQMSNASEMTLQVIQNNHHTEPLCDLTAYAIQVSSTATNTEYSP